MWTDKQFWRDSTWRAFRTFCQSLAGLLTVQQVSANMNAPWPTLIYASAVAGLISLLQSIDRERAVVSTPHAGGEPTYDYNYGYSQDAPTTPLPPVTDTGSPTFLTAPTPLGCGESLR